MNVTTQKSCVTFVKTIRVYTTMTRGKRCNGMHHFKYVINKLEKYREYRVYTGDSTMQPPRTNAVHTQPHVTLTLTSPTTVVHYWFRVTLTTPTAAVTTRMEH